MIRRRAVLGGLTALPLVACTTTINDPAIDVAATGDGYHGTALTDGFPMPDDELTNQDGQPYSLASSPTTKAIALFFGYTNCPDVCPGILADMATARRRLDAAVRNDITLVMVTTDPARDTPERLKEYLKRIDEDFVGLTGDLADITRIASGVGIAIEEGEKLPSGGYEVDHGTQVLGVGSDRLVRVIWNDGFTVADLKDDYTTLVAEA